MLRGGKRGNYGNPEAHGRPPGVLRDRLRGSFEQRVPVLESIADGEPVEVVQVPLLNILEHARCPKCAAPLVAGPGVTALFVTVDGKVSAKPRDRIAAIDLLGKYSIGTLREISTEHVSEKLRETDALLARELPADLYDRIAAQLRRLWAA